MTDQVFDKQINLRISQDDATDIENAAKEREVSQSTLLRIYIRDGLAKYDRKHEELIQQNQGLQLQVNDLLGLLKTSNAMSCATLAAIALLTTSQLDRHTVDGGDRLKGNLKTAFSLGNAVLAGYSGGAFT